MPKTPEKESIDQNLQAPLTPAYKGVPWYGETPLPRTTIHTPEDLVRNLKMVQSGAGTVPESLIKRRTSNEY